MMKTLFLIVLTSLSAHISFAERHYALINDDDGFTFVRSGMGKSFSIIDTLHNDQFFLFEENTKSDWFKVWVANGNSSEGFMHKSRIQRVDAIDFNKISSAFSGIFTQYRLLGENFGAICCRSDKSEQAHKEYTNIRNEIEKYAEEYFLPSLPIYATTFCSHPNPDLFHSFICSLWANSGSASETPSEALTQCLLCNANLVLGSIDKLEDLDQKIYLYEQLEFGLLTVDKDQSEKLRGRREALLKLKKQP